MTLTQLDYIVAVDTHRHFATAADHCHVTQPTLSMQIQKLEDELGVLIFDRSKQPVVPTETGQAILAQAREVLRAARRIPELVNESKDNFRGELKIGIIPTLAPYLLPYFIREFVERYPAVSVQIQELVTEQVIEKLKNGLIDVGIVVTPLTENGITEIPLFREPFLVYTAESHALANKSVITPADLQTEGLWLLTEGHCFRNQVANLCGANRPANGANALRYETGSLETLIKLIDKQDGFTLLPYLATIDMDDARRAKIRPFVAPQPVREVSLVIHRSFLKRKLINALRHEIMAHLPPELSTGTRSSTVVGPGLSVVKS
ncbi:transcriptional regulator, LysR family [Fibrisoma limi BUZ 3]|uniref:Transcriptional regulator, LysR family n=1 Tax=Fibrisoma limi BUZ 3 TaxID=1185876 RepID=I2GKX5_9BACT|nr:hydrogen peroxide-inducible genes activator [Fibrisoma limi]CCH54551.1 transcriptional regulator, LysR family [Fibrisoma limi BUZ 3]